MMSLTVRQERMRLLALASVERLEAGLSAITPPDYDENLSVNMFTVFTHADFELKDPP